MKSIHFRISSKKKWIRIICDRKHEFNIDTIKETKNINEVT